MLSGFTYNPARRQVTQLPKAFSQVGGLSRLVESVHMASYFKDSVAPAPTAFGNAYKLGLETESTARKIIREGDPLNPLKPKNGGIPEFRKKWLREAVSKIDVDKAVVTYHRKMRKCLYKEKTKRSTYNIVKESNSPAGEALMDYLAVLKENNIPLISDTYECLLDATLKFWERALESNDIKVGGKPFDARQVTVNTTAPKDMERDRGSRRNIWIMSTAGKALAGPLDMFGEAICEQLGESIILEGGTGKTSKIMHMAHDLRNRGKDDIVRADVDDKKFNLTIDDEMVQSALAEVLKDPKHRALLEKLTACSLILSRRYIKLPSARFTNGKDVLCLAPEDVEYDMLPTTIKKMFERKEWEKITLEMMMSGGIFLGSTIMGMGVINKTVTFDKIMGYLVFVLICSEKEGRPIKCSGLFASDDVTAVFESLDHFALYCVVMNAWGYHPSPDKSICFKGPGDLPPYCELTGNFIVGATQSCGVSQQINSVKNQGNSPEASVKAGAANVKNLERVGGPIVAQVALYSVNRHLQSILALKDREQRLIELGIWNESPLHKYPSLTLRDCRTDPFYSYTARTGNNDYLLYRENKAEDLEEDNMLPGEVKGVHMPTIYNAKAGGTQKITKQELLFKKRMASTESRSKEVTNLLAKYNPGYLLSGREQCEAKPAILEGLKKKFPELSAYIDEQMHKDALTRQATRDKTIRDAVTARITRKRALDAKNTEAYDKIKKSKL